MLTMMHSVTVELKCAFMKLKCNGEKTQDTEYCDSLTRLISPEALSDNEAL